MHLVRFVLAVSISVGASTPVVALACSPASPDITAHFPRSGDQISTNGSLAVHIVGLWDDRVRPEPMLTDAMGAPVPMQFDLEERRIALFSSVVFYRPRTAWPRGELNLSFRFDRPVGPEGMTNTTTFVVGDALPTPIWNANLTWDSIRASGIVETSCGRHEATSLIDIDPPEAFAGPWWVFVDHVGPTVTSESVVSGPSTDPMLFSSEAQRIDAAADVECVRGELVTLEGPTGLIAESCAPRMCAFVAPEDFLGTGPSDLGSCNLDELGRGGCGCRTDERRSAPNLLVLLLFLGGAISRGTRSSAR